MRVLKRDAASGFLHLQIDSLDDLWTLRNLIQVGDLVTAETMRTAEGATDLVRAGKNEKRPMRLGVRVQEVEWHDFADHLRVLGTIETGPQDHGRHHTLTLRDQAGTDVQIIKAGGILAWHTRLLEDAARATKRPQVVLLAIDDEEAQISVLHSYGVRHLGAVPAGGQGKRFAGAAAAKVRYFEDVLDSVAPLRKGAPLVVVGPGWWREEFLAYGKEKRPEVVQGALTEGTSQAGRAGVQEALGQGIVARLQQGHRVEVETAYVEEVMARIAKEDRIAYGPDDVAKAAAAGAIETLLVSDRIVRAGGQDRLLRDADQGSAEVHIVSTGHDAGQRFDRLGGIAALLRFAYS